MAKTMRTECEVCNCPEGVRGPRSLCGHVLSSGTSIMGLAFFVFLICAFHVPLLTSAEAEIFDRVVAYVDDQAITLSELQEQVDISRKLAPDITEDEVLNTMINRLLLLREAKKYSIEAPSKEEILNEYIDLKVRAFIRVSERDMEVFYGTNQSKFGGKDYDEVREEIEKYLTEKELNERLKETLKELRKKAYVKVQLRPEQ
jgi:hypothetical protein